MRRIMFFMLLVLGWMNMTAAPIKKIDLRVLYVGGSADGTFADEAKQQQSVKERMASFEQLLNTYFTSVTVITADKYTQKMSDGYDVTIMDGVPKPLVPEFTDMKRQVFKKAGYLTEDFNQPMLTIADVSSNIGNRIGCKNDWYCLCLAGEAHSWKKDHPIFEGPFPVKMTVVNKPTPEEAVHFAYLYDGKLPKELPMWQVQTYDYRTKEGSRVGLISRPEGYLEGGDAEIISGGVSTKSLDGIAIGRHANFFHWGFAASPKDMTEEAKNVFANAVVYISKFKGQGIVVRKYNEVIATRSSVDEYKFMTTMEAYEMQVKMTEEANALVMEMVEKAKAKQEKGEELTEQEKGFLQFQPMKIRSREELLALWMPDFFKMFGTDEKAYARYFDENRPYFYGGGKAHGLELDTDAKELGIPNNDLKLIDVAIRALETGKDVARGRRILARYTLEDFATPKEWRDWFEKNRNNMFFTESGGWVFLVNSDKPGVNDYRGWEIRRMQADLQPEMTQENNPVTWALSKEILQSGEQMLFVKMRIHPRYHVYAQVGKGSPFIPLKIDVSLPDGYTKVGEIVKPVALPFNQSGTTMYEDTLVFRLPIEGSGRGTLECTVNYQCCNDQICFPPTEQKFVVELN